MAVCVNDVFGFQNDTFGEGVSLLHFSFCCIIMGPS